LRGARGIAASGPSLGSLQVRRHRVVIDGRPSRDESLLDSCPDRPPQLGCRRTPTHGVAIRYQRRRLHRDPTVEIGSPRIRRVLERLPARAANRGGRTLLGPPAAGGRAGGAK